MILFVVMIENFKHRLSVKVTFIRKFRLHRSSTLGIGQATISDDQSWIQTRSINRNWLHLTYIGDATFICNDL